MFLTPGFETTGRTLVPIFSLGIPYDSMLTAQQRIVFV